MLAVPNFSLAAFAAASLVLLTACGFHLRAGVELPAVLENTYLQSQALYSGIATELRLELQSAGADLTEQRDEATGWSTYSTSARSSACCRWAAPAGPASTSCSKR